MKDHTTYNLQTLFAEDLLLSEAGRQLLQKPLGRLLRDLPEQTRQLITTGDAVTEKANRMGLGQKLSVVDFRVQRERNTHEYRILVLMEASIYFVLSIRPALLAIPWRWQPRKRSGFSRWRAVRCSLLTVKKTWQ